uniref:ArfGAP with dual PH domains 1 n=1 Tax=Sus scrofa TaxID=9823 RepID=A0A8D0XN68_PIG
MECSGTGSWWRLHHLWLCPEPLHGARQRVDSRHGGHILVFPGGCQGVKLSHQKMILEFRPGDPAACPPPPVRGGGTVSRARLPPGGSRGTEVRPGPSPPHFSLPRLLREQWIRAKYERQEFTHPERQEPYSAGYREGFLWKRGRDNGQFLSRKFVLTEREGALKYFNRSDAKEPKAVMKIEHLNATFQPAKIGHPHGLQVTYLKDNSTRNIFVYHEDGKEMVDWFNALRAARFHYLQVAFPGASDADLVPKLSRNYLQEGYMEKTGPKQTEGFRKRWFTMDDRRLMYFKDPLVRTAAPGLLGGRRGCLRDGGGGGGGPEPPLSLAAPRTPSPAGRSSSAAGRAATRCWTGSRRPPRATTGRTASRSSRPSAASCWPVRRSRSSGPGWRPSARWWTGPCCRRSTQWKPTSSINPSEDGPRGPGLWTCWTWPARRRPQEEGAGCTPPSRPPRRPAGGA